MTRQERVPPRSARTSTLTVHEIAEDLRLSIDVVCDLLRDGKMPGQKFGNRWRVLEDAYLEWKRQTFRRGDETHTDDTGSAA